MMHTFFSPTELCIVVLSIEAYLGLTVDGQNPAFSGLPGLGKCDANSKWLIYWYGSDPQPFLYTIQDIFVCLRIRVALCSGQEVDDVKMFNLGKTCAGSAECQDIVDLGKMITGSVVPSKTPPRKIVRRLRMMSNC